MTQRSAVESNTARLKDPTEDSPEGRAPAGELIPGEKVDEVLETLDLPSTDTEDRLEPITGDFEPAVEDEEEALEESLSPEDPVRLYLREIGRVPLLTSEQEVELGQRIERGQERVRRAIMAVPMVCAGLMDLAERLRKREAEPSQFLE